MLMKDFLVYFLKPVERFFSCCTSS